jgi:hypothetical protein
MEEAASFGDSWHGSRSLFCGQGTMISSQLYGKGTIASSLSRGKWSVGGSFFWGERCIAGSRQNIVELITKHEVVNHVAPTSKEAKIKNKII